MAWHGQDVIVSDRMQYPTSDIYHNDQLIAGNQQLIRVLKDYAELVEELRGKPLDDPRRHGLDWECAAERTEIRSLDRFAEAWRKVALGRDKPPYSFIVDLAKKLPDCFEAIVQAPKHVLRRTRNLIDIGRVKEMDARCVDWVMRQPGRSMVERAGHRRQLLAVERYDSYNTLENRVVRSVLQLCIRECRHYLTEYQHGHPSDENVISVDRFLRKLKHLIIHPCFDTVTDIEPVSRPNYVLVHDNRYRLIWRCYLRLIQKMKLQRLLEEHHRELLSEIALGAFLTYFMEGTQKILQPTQAGRFDIGLLEFPFYGAFLDRRFEFPEFEIIDRNIRIRLGFLQNKNSTDFREGQPGFVLHLSGPKASVGDVAFELCEVSSDGCRFRLRSESFAEMPVDIPFKLDFFRCQVQIESCCRQVLDMTANEQ
jgi:hypothetical protein